jgi:hypothetical protein
LKINGYGVAGFLGGCAGLEFHSRIYGKLWHLMSQNDGVHLGAVVQLIVGLVYTGPFRSYGQLLILNAGGTAKDGAPIGSSPWWQRCAKLP